LESWIRPTIPSGTLAVSGTSSHDIFTATNSVTFQHTTPAGSNRLLLVGVSLNNDNLETVSSVTYNTDPLTFVGAAVHLADGDDSRVEIWALVAPDVGTNLDVEVTFSAVTAEGGVVGATSFTGAEQVLPDPADFVSNWDDPGPATVDVPSAAGELVFATVASEYQGLTPDVSLSEQWNDVDPISSGAEYGAAATKAGTTTTTMEWTVPAGAHWAIGAIPIRPAGGGLSDQMTFISKWGGTGSDRSYRFEVETDGTLTLLLADGSPLFNSSTVMNTDTWYHAAVTVSQSSDEVRLYLDGSEEASNLTYTGANGDSTYSFDLGRRDDGSQWFDGNIDEARVSSTVRSAGWLSTGYNNQQAPSAFYIVGAEET